MKLTKLEPKFVDTYTVHVRWMHGDADAYTETEHKVKDPEKHMRYIKDNPQPSSPAEGGDKEVYKKWVVEATDSYCETDTIYNCPAAIDSIKFYYYDESGAKHRAEL